MEDKVRQIVEFVKRNFGVDQLDISCRFDLPILEASQICRELMESGVLEPGPENYNAFRWCPWATVNLSNNRFFRIWQRRRLRF